MKGTTGKLVKVCMIHLISTSLIAYPTLAFGQNYTQNPGTRGVPTNTGYPAATSSGNPSSMMGMMNPFMGGGGSPGNFSNPYGGMTGGGGSMAPMVAMMAVGSAGQLATQIIQSSAQVAMTSALMEQDMQRNQAFLPQVDSYFPQCRTMPAQESHYPESSCGPDSVQQPGHIAQIFSIISQAEKQKFNYEAVLMKGKQLGGSVGLQCFDDQKKKTLDDLHRNKESLKAVIDQVNEATAQFQKNLKPHLDEIVNMNRELQGFQGPASADDRKRDFTKLFNDDKCNMVLDKAADLNPQAGLYALRDKLRQSQTTVDEATVNLKSGYYTEKLNQDLERLVQKDKTDVGSVDGINFAVSDAFFSNEKQVINSKYGQLMARLQEATGITLPENVQNFERGLGADKLPSMDYLKDQVKRQQCMSNAALVTPPARIIEKLEHVTADGHHVPGTHSESLTAYKDALTKIFANNELTLQQQLDRVKAVEQEMNGQQFRALQTTIEGAKNSTRNKYHSVSDIMSSSISYCEKWFQSSPASAGSKMTWNDLISREMTSLENMKTNISTNNDGIVKKLKSRILSCAGVNFSPSPKDCNAGYFDTSTNKNFCIPNAEKCANSFKSCMTKAQGVIDEKEKKLENVAKVYNNKVNRMVKQQNKALKDIVSLVKTQADSFNRYFPEGQFTLPDDLFIPEVPNENTAFGIQLVGNGNFQFMALISDKLKQAYAKMQEQETKIGEVLQKRHDELATRYKEEKTYWETLIKKCQQAEQGYRQKVAQANQAMMQKQEQQQREFMRMCTQLQNAAVGPGCQGQAQNLSNTMSQVAGQMGMGPEAWKIQQMNQTCNFMNTAQQMQSQDTILQSALGANFRIQDLCDFSSSEGVADRFNNYITGNGWQIAAVLSAKHGTQLGPDQIKNCVDHAVGQVTKIGGSADLRSLNATCGSLTSPMLSQSPTGKYLDSLIKLNYLLKDKSTVPGVDASGAKVERGGGFCETIREKMRAIRDNVDNKYTEDKAICEKASTATTFTGGAAPISAAQVVEDCYKNIVSRELNQADSNDPLAAKFYSIGELIKNMALLTNQLQADAGLHLTQAMGQTPNMGCAAVYMNSRNAPTQGGAGGMFNDQNFMNAIRAGGI